MNLKFTRKVLKKLSILFPLPTDGNDGKAFLAIWQLALDGLEESDVIEAVKILLLTMTRFPYPAELRAVVKSSHHQQETSASAGGFPLECIERLKAQRAGQIAEKAAAKLKECRCQACDKDC